MKQLYRNILILVLNLGIYKFFNKLFLPNEQAVTVAGKTPGDNIIKKLWGNPWFGKKLLFS